MADYTDRPFTRLCRQVAGKDFVVFKEMVSSEAIVRGNKKTLKMCAFTKNERPLIIQIFGDNPEVMAQAAKIIEKKFKPDGIDINMGCPVPKIAQKSAAGAALMRNPKLAAAIVKSVKKAVKLPISVKTRLGWNDKKDILKFAEILEQAGADLLTVHGRTKVQGYAEQADWEMIAEVKKILKIPLIANGDIVDAESAKKCLNITGADGIMIGRGALGKPWIFQEVESRKLSSQGGSASGDAKRSSGGKVESDKKNIVKIVLKHAKMHEKYYGQGSLVTFRKHLAFYFKGMLNIKEFRAQLMQIKQFKELEKVLKEYLKK